MTGDGAKPAASPGVDFVTSWGFQLGGLSLTFARMSGPEDHLTAGRGHHNAVDHLTVTVIIAGVAEGIASTDVGDRHFVAGPGAVLLTDMSRQMQYLSTANKMVLLTVPRDSAAAVLGPIDNLHGTVLRPENAALFVTHVLKLRPLLETATAPQRALLGNTVLDLLAYCALVERGIEQGIERGGLPPTPGGRDAVLLQRVCDIIEARLGSPSLGIADLCRRLEVSRSALYRLFDGLGGVQAYIRDRRLERVKAVLADPQDGTRIGDLAEFWGFSDAAHLSRLFRARYGVSPRDFRHGQR